MSNIISFLSRRGQTEAHRTEALLSYFATARRHPDDVFWLKENAEFLGILSATGTRPDAPALAPYDTFYQSLTERLAFFPQYYRFFLSICLDLEDLGHHGGLGLQLAQHVARDGLAEAEMSDLQRAEARRLLLRGGVDGPEDPALDARLRRFAQRTETFALPNKKAAYELTHIVFYLSEYGRKDPGLDDAVQTSLTYAGILAYLDQNTDLLAEICTALRFCGAVPPAEWERAVGQAHGAMQLVEPGTGARSDGYHAYLVTGWAMAVAGQPAFTHDVPAQGVEFVAGPAQGALRDLSKFLLDLGSARSDDWHKMRPGILKTLGPAGQAVLQEAEASSDLFEPFFAQFARAGTP